MDYRTALITGASSGMGRSVARRLARDGIQVVLCTRHDFQDVQHRFGHIVARIVSVDVRIRPLEEIA